MRREAAKRKLERQQQRRIEQAHKRKRNVVITVVAVVAAVAVVAVVFALLPSGSGEPAPPPAAQAVTPASIPTEIAPMPKRAEALPASVSCTYGPDPQGQAAARPVEPPPATGVSTQGTATLTLQTTDGAIPMTLDRALAPCTVNSMISLAQQGYFDNTTCHRLTTAPGLQVLQCGDPTGEGTGGPGYTTPDELVPGTKYGRGMLAMANTGAPDSGGSQFFIVYGDGSALDSRPTYTVFGSVGAEGLRVVDEIARRGHDGSLDPSPGGGKPVTPVTIEKAVVS